MKTNKMHFSFLIYSDNLILYMFRIEYLFIIRRQLLYMQHTVFIVLRNIKILF